MITQICADIRDWVKIYDGPLFHALFADCPYNLESITKSFGKNGSAPAKFGTDGVFRRSSAGFMNQQWDSNVSFDPQLWYDLGQLLYPGAFIMAYGGTRTYHRMAIAVEEAGFVIHPAIGFLFSSGFPKAANISKIIDRRLGLKGEPTGEKKTGFASGTHKHAGTEDAWGFDDEYEEVAPSSPLAKTWSTHRYGLQAMKPAFEFILVAQKPYGKSPIDDITSSGAGAINIDGARIGSRWPSNIVAQHLNECIKIGEQEESYPINRFTDGAKPFGNGAGHEFETEMQTNIHEIWKCAPGCPVSILQEQMKNNGSNGSVQDIYYNPQYVEEEIELANNFMFASKVTPEERNAGVDGIDSHPTLKSIQLNRWLSSLLLPPIEYYPRRLLNPYGGVASEAIGAELAGWDEIVSVELTPEYIPIGKARIEYWTSFRSSGKDAAKLGKAQLSFDDINV